MDKRVLWTGLVIIIVSVSVLRASIKKLHGPSLKSRAEGLKHREETTKKQDTFGDQKPPFIIDLLEGTENSEEEATTQQNIDELISTTLETPVDSSTVRDHIKQDVNIATESTIHEEDKLIETSTIKSNVLGEIANGSSSSFYTYSSSHHSSSSSSFNVHSSVHNTAWNYDSDALLNLRFDFFGGQEATEANKENIDQTIKNITNNNSGGLIIKQKNPSYESVYTPEDISHYFFHRWNLKDIRVDHDLPEFFSIPPISINLTRKFQSLLKPIDFLDFDDFGGTGNCFACSIFAIKNITSDQLLKDFNFHVDEIARSKSTLSDIMSIFQRLGFPEAEIVFQGSPEDAHNYIHKYLAPGEGASFALASMDENDTGNVVMMRAWKENADNNVSYLLTDFQQSVSDPKRFSITLPSEAKTLHIIHTRATSSQNAITDDMIMPQMRGNCNGKRVIGYLGSWSDIPMSLRQAARLTNVIYAFAKMDGNGALSLPEDALARQRLSDAFVARKAMTAKGLKLEVSVSIGGGLNSQYLSNIMLSAAGRSKLVSNIVNFVKNYGFDGVDIDWEYPGSTGRKTEDRQNYVLFLYELRKTMGNNKLISIAAPPGEDAINGIDAFNIAKYVNWIGVMAYDFHGAWDSEWGSTVGPNAPLYHGSPPEYAKNININWVVQRYVCNSRTPNKLMLGIPFYGRYWTRTVTGKYPTSYPLFRKGLRVNGKFGGEKTYRELSSSWLSKNSSFQFFWNSPTRTPWGFDHKTGTVLTYDNPSSINEKVKYALEANLGGVMIWNVNQDSSELTLTKSVIGICQSTGNSVNFKC